MEYNYFDAFSITERFDDIVNTLKGFYFRLAYAESKKDVPDEDLIKEFNERRGILGLVGMKNQNELGENYTLDEKKKLLDEALLPELRYLQTKYPDV